MFWLLLLLTATQLEAKEDAMKKNNEKHVKYIKEVLKDKVAEDIKDRMKLLKDWNTDTETIHKDIREYLDSNIDFLQEKFTEQLKNLDEDFQAKMKNLEKNLNDNLDEAEKGLAQKLTKNIDTLNKKTKLQRDAVVDWSHTRANYQENILATRLTICAQDYGHFDKG